MNSSRPDWLQLIPRLVVLAGFALLFALGGCARTPQPRGTVRVAVLDGRLSYDVAPGGEVERLGWWFGSRDRYTASNVGVIAGDVLAREFGKLPGIEIYSRADYTLYMAQKERLLRRAHPELTSQGRKRVLSRLDPIDYGRSLNVDYVIQAEILESATTTNLVISAWWSDLKATLNIYNVATGQRVGYFYYDKTKDFASQVAVLEDFARRGARQFLRDDPFNLYQE